MLVRRLLLPLMSTFALLPGSLHAQHPSPAGPPTATHAGQGFVPQPKVHALRAFAVPFELYRGNRVLVSARLNGKATPALLDTGASTTTLDRAYARSIGIPQGQKIEARGAGGVVEAELVHGVSFEISGIRFDDMSVAVMDLEGIARHLGRPLPLIVGRELFNNAAIAFDWDSGKLTVTPTGQFTPPLDATLVPVERRGPFNFVKLSIAGLPPIDAVLDLGNGGAVNLPSDYWSAQPTLASLRYAEAQSGGVGGVFSTRAVTLPGVEFAGHTFNRVPAVLGGDSQGGEAAHGANLGIAILKQFDLVLDLGRDRIFVKRRAKAAAFDRDRAGVRTELHESRLRLSFVSPQGPAAAAGLKAGDHIVSIDGRSIDNSYFASPEWNRLPAGTPITLTLADGRVVRVTLEDYY